MFETTLLLGLKPGIDSVWHFSFQLPKQKLVIMVNPPLNSRDKKANLQTYFASHFEGLNTFDSNDLEFLMAKIIDLLGECPVVGVVFGQEALFYGVQGGFAYFKRGARSGFLTLGNPPAFSQGFLEKEDILVVGVGSDYKSLVEIATDDRREFLPENIISTEGAGFRIRLKEGLHIPPIAEREEVVSSQKISRITSLTRWFSVIQSDLLGRKKTPNNPSVYVKNEERKKLGGLALVVFLVLLVSVGLGWTKRQALLRKEAFALVYEPALTLLIEAEKNWQDTPQASREKLLEAQKKVSEAQITYEEKSDEHQKLSTLAGKIEALYIQVSGEKEIDSPAIFYDLNLVKEGMNGSKMAYGDGQLVVLDTSASLLVGVDISTKNAKVLAGGELLTGASLVTASTGKAVVLTQKGLVGAFFGTRTPELLVARDDVWKQPVALGMFGGNVYLVDGETSEVWQYPGFDGSLGERKRWFGPGISPNLSQTISIGVDGDLWLGQKNGEVLHYRRGAPLNFTFSQLATPTKEISALVTNYEKDDLVILDKPNERVVLFDKKGLYRKQFSWTGFLHASDMLLVDLENDNQLLLVLSGSTIYQIPLE